MHTVIVINTASTYCLTSSVGVVHAYCVLPLTYSLDLLFNIKLGVVQTYCVLPLTYSLDLLFNVKCRSCSCILCIAINLQPRLVV